MLSTPGAETAPSPDQQYTDYDRPGSYRRPSSESNRYASPGYTQPVAPTPSVSSQGVHMFNPPPSSGSWNSVPQAPDPSGRSSASIYGRHTPEHTMSRRSVSESLRSKTPHSGSRPSSSMGGMPPPQAQTPSTTNSNYMPNSLRPGPQYPDQVNGRVDTPSRLDTMSPQSMTSRHSAGHRRSTSLNATAGMTPVGMPRPLSSTAPAPHTLRRVSSNASASSQGSRISANYSHYDPKSYVYPAFLASSDDLTNMQSPNTWANTRANASHSNRARTPLSPSSMFSALH